MDIRWDTTESFRGTEIVFVEKKIFRVSLYVLRVDITRRVPTGYGCANILQYIISCAWGRGGAQNQNETSPICTIFSFGVNVRLCGGVSVSNCNNFYVQNQNETSSFWYPIVVWVWVSAIAKIFMCRIEILYYL